MKTIIFVLLLCLFCFFVKAQSANNKLAITKAEKSKLENFWKKFKKAVLEENKTGIASVCDFPVSCDYCDSVNGDNPNIKITKANFYTVNYRIFFSEYLKEVVNKKKILQIVGKNNDTNFNEYNFSFPIVKPSKRGEGKQGFFSLEKIKGEFKITSVWSIP